MLLLVATLLASTPVTPAEPAARVVSRGFRARLDVGGLVGASWYVDPSRRQLEAALLSARDTFFSGASLDGQTLLFSTPVVGPVMLARLGGFDATDQALLLTAGALQLLGLSVSTYRFVNEELGGKHEGLELSVSPIAGGRLGLGIKLTGF